MLIEVTIPGRLHALIYSNNCLQTCTQECVMTSSAAIMVMSAVNDKGGQGDPYFEKLETGKCYQAIGSFLSGVVSVGYSTFSGIMLYNL